MLAPICSQGRNDRLLDSSRGLAGRRSGDNVAVETTESLGEKNTDSTLFFGCRSGVGDVERHLKEGFFGSSCLGSRTGDDLEGSGESFPGDPGDEAAVGDRGGEERKAGEAR